MSTPLRILLAVDGSETALAAARCWSTWQGTSAQPLQALLLAVVAPLPHAWPMPGTEPGVVERTLTALGQRQLEAAREAFARTGLAWEAAVRIGAPAAVIVDEAQRGDAQLIAMGTRGLTPLAGLLLGSVALRVVQTSRIPVWLMPPGSPCPQALGRRLRLLVAVDGSEHANAAARWAALAAPRFGSTAIELLRRCEPIAQLVR